MELCCPPHALPTLPHRNFIAPTSPFPRSISSFSSVRALRSHSKPGTRWLRATASDETSTFVSEPFDKSTNEAEPAKIVETTYEAISTEEGPEQSAALEFLSKLNLKMDSEETYNILVYGTGTLVVLWISAAVVGALDSLPLFPKVMEVVGLAFTVWFSYRYLIFKKNRDELFAKIDDLKEQIIGSDDN